MELLPGLLHIWQFLHQWNCSCQQTQEWEMGPLHCKILLYRSQTGQTGLPETKSSPGKMGTCLLICHSDKKLPHHTSLPKCKPTNRHRTYCGINCTTDMITRTNGATNTSHRNQHHCHYRHHQVRPSSSQQGSTTGHRLASDYNRPIKDAVLSPESHVHQPSPQQSQL